MLRTNGDSVQPVSDDSGEWTITTSDVHPRDRLEYWIETSRRVLGPYEIRPHDVAGFEGELRHVKIPGMALSLFHCNGMHAWRTKRQASLLADTVHIAVQVGGSVKILQDGHEANLGVGDLCLIDLGRPASFFQSYDTQCLVFEVARRDCEARLGPLARWTGRRVDGSHGGGALASAFARMLPDQIRFLSGSSQSQIKLQFLDLVALALKEAEGTGFVHSSARLASLLRLKTVVDDNLTNCSATCEELASAAGISVRYANQLLETEQTSLQRLLFSRRIEKCQAALADPAQTHRQISDIAYCWGFGDVSHFGRLFKAVVGMTPRDFKKQSLGLVDRI
jgi:AraC-like DNA-binding protein